MSNLIAVLDMSERKRIYLYFAHVVKKVGSRNILKAFDTNWVSRWDRM